MSVQAVRPSGGDSARDSPPEIVSSKDRLKGYLRLKMRVYYNQRVGEGGEPELTLEAIARRVTAAYGALVRDDYLQKAFGYYCVDQKDVEGDDGSDLITHFHVSTGIKVEKSLEDFLVTTDEVGLFTIIEFLHDHIAKPDPDSGWHHSYMGCGMHYDHHTARFDADAARSEWRAKINPLLKFYGEGFALSSEGEIVHLAPDGLERLLDSEAPVQSGDTNKAKLRNAVRTFRRGLSTRLEQKQAIRDLVDLLEFYRPQVKAHLLTKDESELFNIANNYAIRHHNVGQKDDYDDSWLNWLFYLYLSTVHLVLELVHGRQQAKSTALAEDDDIPF
jgi:hypothetical protein